MQQKNNIFCCNCCEEGDDECRVRQSALALDPSFAQLESFFVWIQAASPWWQNQVQEAAMNLSCIAKIASFSEKCYNYRKKISFLTLKHGGNAINQPVFARI